MDETMVKTILFDLDGTLLPMDQEVFVKTYLGLLAGYLVPYGYEPKKLVEAVWKGVGAMAANDGSRRNEEVFWTVFAEIFGRESLKDRPVIEEFYRGEFQKVQSSCGFNPESAKLVLRLKERGYRLILATNPVFPQTATYSRIRWAGLSPSDFEFCTTYENISFSKPNPEYYREILTRRNLRAEECLMVGNDVDEDMTAEKTGMKVFLLTDCLIRREKDISRYPRGGFADLSDYLGIRTDG